MTIFLNEINAKLTGSCTRIVFKNGLKAVTLNQQLGHFLVFFFNFFWGGNLSADVSEKRVIRVTLNPLCTLLPKEIITQILKKFKSTILVLF